MNIVFEGITGGGKTSIIKLLVAKMQKEKMKVKNISEIDKISPLSGVLEKMYESDTFLRMKQPIDTIIAESLILAADYQYMKEYTRKFDGFVIFDRDIFTEIVYQKYFIEKRYGKENSFFHNWEKCIMFDPKTIDLVVYVEVPLSVGISRNEFRDNRKFTDEQKNILKDLSKLQKIYIHNYCKDRNIDLIMLDGTQTVEYNAMYVLNFLKDKEKRYNEL
mgnify:CR=1 FL=1